jgi:hypothetical protein
LAHNLQGKFAGYFSSDRQQEAVKTRGADAAPMAAS